MTLRRRRLLAAGSAALLSGSTLALPARAQQTQQAQQGVAAREALLIPGKRTLRQRILTKPDATLSPTPGAPAGGTPPSPLTPMFVYARQNGPDGTPWLELGRASRGATVGWLPEAKTIAWLHTMTAAFHNPAGRPSTLFFHERDKLQAMLGGAAPSQEAAQLADIARRPQRPDNFPIAAVEPETFIDIKKQFYLLPILQAESITFQDGREYRMLEVASIPMGGTAGAAQTGAFSVGIAFVVDTTLSMDPYINKVRAALTEFVRQTAAEPGTPTRYALTGFRNSLERQSRLEYRTQTFARFADSTDANTFIQKIQGVRATTVDSLSFNEDSFGAVADAIDNLDWGDLQGRVIILVTDAGSLPLTDRFSNLNMRAEELGEKARAAGIALMALHLKTPQGANNHAYAEQQYTTLTSVPLPTLGPQYFPVAGGSADILDRTVRDMLTKLRAVRGDQQASQARNNPPPPEDRSAMIGHAMRLAWLGRRGQAAAPDVVRAWAPDGYKGANPPECLEVRVLLTRNQLNDLAQALRIIVDEGRAGILGDDVMFNRLQTVAAHLARDPEAIRQRGLETLGGVLGEYLDDLPYVSEVASMDRTYWRSMGPDRQIAFLDKLESRLRLYQDFNRTPELWKSFDDGRDPGEAVFPVPLSALP